MPVRSAAGGQRLDIAIADIDNFRGALAWTMRSGSIELGLAIATAVEQMWVVVDPSEGIRWFERLFGHPQPDSVPPTLRAGALRAYGSSLHIGGRPDSAEDVWTQSLAIYDSLDDKRGRATMLHRLGIAAMLRGDLESARAQIEISDAIHRRNDYTFGRAETTGTLGAIARESGDTATALRARPRKRRARARS